MVLDPKYTVDNALELIYKKYTNGYTNYSELRKDLGDINQTIVNIESNLWHSQKHTSYVSANRDQLKTIGISKDIPKKNYYGIVVYKGNNIYIDVPPRNSNAILQLEVFNKKDVDLKLLKEFVFFEQLSSFFKSSPVVGGIAIVQIPDNYPNHVLSNQQDAVYIGMYKKKNVLAPSVFEPKIKSQVAQQKNSPALETLQTPVATPPISSTPQLFTPLIQEPTLPFLSPTPAFTSTPSNNASKSEIDRVKALVRQKKNPKDKKYVDPGYIVDFVFKIAPKYNVDPYLFLAFIYAETEYGNSSLAVNGIRGPEITGDKIPRSVNKKTGPGGKETLKNFMDRNGIPYTVTNEKIVPSGYGWGYGLCAIDLESFVDFIKSGQWKDPEKCIDKGLSILASNRLQLEKFIKKNNLNLSTFEFQLAVMASYNAGVGGAQKAIKGTTGLLIDRLQKVTFDKNYLPKILEESRRLSTGKIISAA